MIVRHLLLVVIGTVSIAACGHADGDSTNDTTNVDTFLAGMVPHHRLGLEMLEHAVPRVDDVRVRRLVFEMSGYHGDELHHWESQLFHDAEVSIFPGWIAPDRLAALDDHTGPEYDVNWLVLMIEHHEGAIQLAADELTRVSRNSDPARHELAQRIAATQRAEIKEMRTLAQFLCSEHAHLVPCEQVKPEP